MYLDISSGQLSVSGFGLFSAEFLLSCVYCKTAYFTGIKADIIMNESKLNRTAVIAYLVTAILFTAFFIYMCFFENEYVYSARESGTFSVVNDYSETQVTDPDAPVGMHREFSWTLEPCGEYDTVMAFYVVHSNVEVYFDDELMYRLCRREDSVIGRSVASNWVIVPVYSQDEGKEVQITVTPVYSSVKDVKIQFFTGSINSILYYLLDRDFYPLIISGLCIVLGILIMAVWTVLVKLKKVGDWDIFYLGNFSVFLGIWKMTDTRLSAFIFEKNSMALGYITIGVLFLAAIPFILYIKGVFADYKTKHFLAASLIATAAAAAALFCQVFGILDFKQTLPLAHAVVIMTICVTVFTAFGRKDSENKEFRGRFWIFVLILASGVIADLICMYVRNSSSGLVFTITLFLVFMVVVFTMKFYSINIKAYTDTLTGLNNRSRWNELMNEEIPDSRPCALIMVDLNHLKSTNDIMGHKFGDKMIRNFAAILRKAVPDSDTLCRWGGDEFAIMAFGADEQYVSNLIKNINEQVENYNITDGNPRISYAAGYALSSEFPGYSKLELLEKADERMYSNKKLWY